MGRHRFSLMNDIGGGEIMHSGMAASLPTRKSLPISSPSSDAIGDCVDGEESCIIHYVSKFDTLAGVAIKYGVEVADIKRVNGLVTDLQMFALKTLQIPRPGRHPPSHCLSNGDNVPPWQSSTKQYSSRRHSDLLDSFPSLKLKSTPEEKVSSAMRRLQGYYGIRSATQNYGPEVLEMAAHEKGGAHSPENGRFPESSPVPLSQYRKSKSTADFLLSKNSQETSSGDSDKSNEKLVRRRQKSVGDFTLHTPEKIQEEENTSAVTAKASPCKSHSANRTVPGGVDGEAGEPLSPIPISLMDSFLTNVVSVVKKSSSASSLHDSADGSLSSLWTKTKQSFKPDFQALSTVAIARPIFDGLVYKQMGRRNKAALD